MEFTLSLSPPMVTPGGGATDTYFEKFEYTPLLGGGTCIYLSGSAHLTCCNETLLLLLLQCRARTSASRNPTDMSGIVSTLQHHRDKNQGIGTNSHAIRYLNQDFQDLRNQCLESGCLFQDDTFPALPSSLGFNELGRGSPKINGVNWIRPTVSQLGVNCQPASQPYEVLPDMLTSDTVVFVYWFSSRTLGAPLKGGHT